MRVAYVIQVVDKDGISRLPCDLHNHPVVFLNRKLAQDYCIEQNNKNDDCIFMFVECRLDDTPINFL